MDEGIIREYIILWVSVNRALTKQSVMPSPDK